MFSISSEKGIPLTWSELLRQICSKGKQEWVSVGLLTFVFSNHPSVFQGFTGEALHSFPSGCTGKKEYTRTWNRLQAPTSESQHFIHVHCYFILPGSLTSKEREINYSTARKAGCVRAPKDIQVPSTDKSSHSQRGVGEEKHPIKTRWRHFFK